MGIKYISSYPNKTSRSSSKSDNYRQEVNSNIDDVGTILNPIGDHAPETVTENGNTIILRPNLKRIYAMIRNLEVKHTDSTPDNDLVFSYTDDPNILQNGMLVKAEEGYELEAVQSTVYARSVNNNRVKIALDIGVA